MSDPEKASYYSKAILAEPQVVERTATASPTPSDKVSPQVVERDVTLSSTPYDKIPHQRSSLARIKSMRARTRCKQKPLAGDRFFKACRRLPLVVKAFLVTVVTGLPFAIFLGLSYTTYKGRIAGDGHHHVTYQSLALWLSIAWASLLVIFALAEGFGRLGRWICGMSRKTIRFVPLAQTMCFRVTMITWVGIMHLATCKIWPHSEDPKHKNTWTYKLREAFMFLVIAFAIIFVQGLCLQLIAIRYVGGYVGPRSQRASDELEVIQELNSLVKPHVGADDLGFVAKMLRRAFMPVEDSVFDDIRNGRSDEDEVRSYADTIWVTIAGNRASLTANDITGRLRAMGRDEDKGEELFILLDESCDSEVTRDELQNLVMKTAAQLRKRAKAMQGIQLLLGKLEFLLSIVMFIFIIFVYTQFFPQDFAKHITALWTGLIGLGFAIGGAVTEFVNSCVFVFAKHAYDIGDFVALKGLKLVVTSVHLTHTNFEETTSPDARGKVVQISHSALMAEPIINWTRSENEVQEEVEAEKTTAAADKP